MAPRVVSRYDYVDELGEILFQVERLVPKGFRQRRPDGAGGWVYSLEGTRRVLYRLPEVVEAVARDSWVVLCEGEKDVETVQELLANDAVATTAPGGAGKWAPEFTETLRGAKVWMIPDVDEAGARHALTVACELDRVVAKLRIMQPATPHKDVSDHLAAGLTLRDLCPFDRAAAQERLQESRGRSTRRRLVVMSARDFCRRPSLNGKLELLGPTLYRTMRLTIGALTGDGKTTLGLQMIRAVVHGEPFLEDEWRGTGKRALVVDVEQGEETVKQRLRDLGMDDDPNVDLLWEPNGLALDQSRDDRREVEQALAVGHYDVALLDPLYQLHCGEENNERTAAEVMGVLDGWARRYELGMIIPMHRRKPLPQVGVNQWRMSDIGGHGAWVRNSEIVFGLHVVHDGYSQLTFFKDRVGKLPGIGHHYDLSFNKRTSSFSRVVGKEEQGWSVTKRLLRDTPEPMTTAAIAAARGLALGTVVDHLRRIEAHADVDDLPRGRRGPKDDWRWSLEPWPDSQTSLLDEGSS
jgi:hypothetical protein